MLSSAEQRVVILESRVEHQEASIADLKERVKAIESRRFGFLGFLGFLGFFMGILAGFAVAVFIFN